MLQPHALFRSVSSRLLDPVQLHNVINIHSKSMNSQTLLRNYKKKLYKTLQKTQRKAYKETLIEKGEIQKPKKNLQNREQYKKKSLQKREQYKKQRKTCRKGGNTKTKEKLTKKLRKAYKNKANLLSLIAEKIMYVYHAFRTFINYLVYVFLG